MSWETKIIDIYFSFPKRSNNFNICICVTISRLVNEALFNPLDSYDIIISRKVTWTLRFPEITGESVNLGIYEDEVIIVNTINGEFYQLQTTLLPVSPLYCSEIGKLFLSECDDKF